MTWRSKEVAKAKSNAFRIHALLSGRMEKLANDAGVMSVPIPAIGLLDMMCCFTGKRTYVDNSRLVCIS